MAVKEYFVSNYVGEVDPSKLIPYMGESFEMNEDFKEIVSLLKYWQYQHALERLDENITNETNLVDSLLLKGELLAMYEYPEHSIEAFQKVITYEPNNLYALSMLLVERISARRPTEEINAYRSLLKDRSPNLYGRLNQLLVFIEKHKMNPEVPEIEAPLDLICVCGYFLHPDGSLPEKLENRLIKTRELAAKYPDAKILLSGGAVQNQYVEALEMKKQLILAGVDENRIVALEKARDTVGNVIEFAEYIQPKNFQSICVVSSRDHLPRAWMTLYVGLKRIGYKAEVFGSALHEHVDSESLERERQFSYQTVLRIAGFFSKMNIEWQEKNLLEPFDL